VVLVVEVGAKAAEEIAGAVGCLIILRGGGVVESSMGVAGVGVRRKSSSLGWEEVMVCALRAER